MLAVKQSTISLFKNNIITFIASALLYINCGFFITFSNEGSILAAFCPQYLFFYLALIYTIFLISKEKIIQVSVPVILGLITIVYVLITQFVINGGRPIAVLGSVVAVLFYILGCILLPKLNFKQVKFIADAAIIFSLIIFSTDTLYKLINCGFNLVYMFFFYRVKSSLLYPDTNTMGIQITFFIVLSYYLFKKSKQKWYLPLICLYIFLAFCTFSRAAVIAILLMFGYDIVWESIKIILTKFKQEVSPYIIPAKKLFSYIALTVSTFIGILTITFIMVYLFSDASFGTKLDLFNDTVNFLKNANLKDLFFGIGYNNGRITEFSDLPYAHTYLATYVCETGIIGFTLFSTFLISILLNSYKTIYVFIPFLIFSFAYLGHTHLHVCYSVLAFIVYFEKCKLNKSVQKINEV